MLSRATKSLGAIVAALPLTALLVAVAVQPALGDAWGPTRDKSEAKASPTLSRQSEPAAVRRPEAPQSVIRMGRVKQDQETDDPAPLDKGPTAPAPDAETPAKATDAPGRIQPHNPQPVAANVLQLVHQAHQLSGSAESEEDFTQILNLCQQAAAQAEDDEVLAYLNRLAAWAYDYRGQLVSDQASLLAVSGKLSDARKQEQRALADFDRAVHLDPTRWRAVHNRGVSYALLGQDKYAAALKDFDRTIQLEPKFYKAWFNRAEVRRELGEHEKALEDYTQAVRLKPDDPLAHRGRAHAAYQLGQLRSALDDFARVVELAPQDPLAWVDRADLYAELHRWELSARDYQQALKIDKQLGRAYLGAAWLMATCPDQRIRNPEFSVKAAEKAIELDGTKDHHYLDTLAAAYASAGMYREAKAAAEQAIETAPAKARQAVKNRLALYQQEQPYQQPTRAVRPAGATSP